MGHDMRKLLWAVLALPGIAVAAPTYEPFSPPGGVVTPGIVTLQDQYTSSAGGNVNTPRIQLYNGASDVLAGGPDAVWMGGWALPAVSGSAGDPATSAIVNIAARPYGNYNNGCALCVIATGGTQTDSAGRAAISGTDWHEGVSANAGMGDIVGFYEHLDNAPARLILPVTAYTATWYGCVHDRYTRLCAALPAA